MPIICVTYQVLGLRVYVEEEGFLVARRLCVDLIESLLMI